MLFLNNFEFYILEIYFIFSLFFLLVLGVFLEDNKKIDLNIILTNLSIIVFCYLFLLSFYELNLNFFLFNFHVMFTTFDQYLKTILILFFILFLFFFRNSSFEEGLRSYELIILILISFVGLFYMICINDFIGLYLSMELQSLTFYVLASYKRYTKISTESGLKYFILGSFSSGLLLLGITFIYLITGSLNFNDIYILIEVLNFNEIDLMFYSINFSIILIFFGLFFKLGIFPFYMWVPDVYEGSPLVVVSFFAVFPKLVFLGVLLKLLYFCNILYITNWHLLFIFCGVFSIIIGSFGAFYQQNLKRLLGFGAISHMGFVILSLGLQTYDSFVASFFYLCIYMLLSLTIFITLFVIKKVLNLEEIVYFNDFSKIIRSNVGLSFVFSLVLFSLAGVPPLAGFFSKFFVLNALVSEEMFFFSFLIIIVSLISAAYYLRVIKVMYFEKPIQWNFLINCSIDKAYVLSILTFINLSFMFFLPFFYLIFEILVLRLL